ncbi:hypothetical protein GCM10027176_09080 [Actinoallomurus bryophytorum]|uniref:Uncharacterized protein n=1 Tax=Actinoallomurus bryophytorum TaxID=1490222 RepID=A0A543CGA9_9ACTN|nr:hypothetical protein [Actinoallomurus bryophytorum]TQL95957.1 hypothetical protein FB559_1470 [Actinoallomurus bryophytorum]
MTTQLFTLLGVALGAFSSYLVSFLGERTRYRRDISGHWTERKLESYARYLSDAKYMSTLTRRVAASVGLDDQALALSRDEGLPLLAEAETKRGLSSEVVSLIGGKATVEAHRRVNKALWRMEQLARGLIKGSGREEWVQARREYVNAMNDFHENARLDLIVPGEYTPRDTKYLMASDDSLNDSGARTCQSSS